jgi:hypothetical protein
MSLDSEITMEPIITLERGSVLKTAFFGWMESIVEKRRIFVNLPKLPTHILSSSQGNCPYFGRGEEFTLSAS